MSDLLASHLDGLCELDQSIQSKNPTKNNSFMNHTSILLSCMCQDFYCISTEVSFPKLSTFEDLSMVIWTTFMMILSF